MMFQLRHKTLINFISDSRNTIAPRVSHVSGSAPMWRTSWHCATLAIQFQAYCQCLWWLIMKQKKTNLRVHEMMQLLFMIRRWWLWSKLLVFPTRECIAIHCCAVNNNFEKPRWCWVAGDLSRWMGYEISTSIIIWMGIVVGFFALWWRKTHYGRKASSMSILIIIFNYLWLFFISISLCVSSDGMCVYNREHKPFIIGDTVRATHSCVADFWWMLHVWREIEFFEWALCGSMIGCAKMLRSESNREEKSLKSISSLNAWKFCLHPWRAAHPSLNCNDLFPLLIYQ